MKKKLFLNLLYLCVGVGVFLIIFEGVLLISSDYCVFNSAILVTQVTQHFTSFDEVEISILLILTFTIGVVIHSIFISTLICHWLFTKTLGITQIVRDTAQKLKRNMSFVIFSCVFFLPFGWLPTMVELIILITIGNLYQKIPLEHSRRKRREEFTNVIDYEIE